MMNPEPGTAGVRSNLSNLKKSDTFNLNSHMSPDTLHFYNKHNSKNTQETDNITFLDVRSRNIIDHQIGNSSEFSFVVG